MFSQVNLVWLVAILPEIKKKRDRYSVSNDPKLQFKKEFVFQTNIKNSPEKIGKLSHVSAIKKTNDQIDKVNSLFCRFR
jgi:hypothetical protein